MRRDRMPPPTSSLRGAVVRPVYILGVQLVHSRKQLGIASIDCVDSELFRLVTCHNMQIVPHAIDLRGRTSLVTAFIMCVPSLSSLSATSRTC